MSTSTAFQRVPQDAPADWDPGQNEIEGLYDAVLSGFDVGQNLSISRSSSSAGTLGDDDSRLSTSILMPIPFTITTNAGVEPGADGQPPTPDVQSLNVPPPPPTTRSISESASSGSSRASSSVVSSISSSTRRRPLPQPPGSSSSSTTSTSSHPTQSIGTATTTHIPSATHTRSTSTDSTSTAVEQVSIARPTQPPSTTLPPTSNSQFTTSAPALSHMPSRSATSFRGGRSTVRRRNSQKLNDFARPVIFAPELEAAAANGGVVFIPDEEEVPTDLNTEFPDHYGAYLPTYYPDVQEDPNASQVLEVAPPATAGGRNVRSALTADADLRFFHDRLGIGSTMYSSSSDTLLSIGSLPILRRPNSTSEIRLLSHVEEADEQEYDDFYPSSSTTATATPNVATPRYRTSTANSVIDIGPHNIQYRSPVTPKPETHGHSQAHHLSSPVDTGSDWDPHDSHEAFSFIQLIANFDGRIDPSSPNYRRSRPPNPGSATLHEFDDIDPYYASTYVYTSTNSELDGRRFMDISLLSNLAVQLKDKVPRGTHVKGSIPYPRAFTGKDAVSTLHAIITRELQLQSGINPPDKRPALLVARSLQNLLFFYEVEWGSRVLQDGVEDVYMFLDDYEIGGSSSGSGSGGVDEPSGSGDTRGANGTTGGIIDTSPIERTELPTGIITFLTKCYSPLCDGYGDCYTYDCPRRGLTQLPTVIEPSPSPGSQEWSQKVPPQVLSSLSDGQISRQTIIHKIISKEEQYLSDLDTIHNVFIKGLHVAHPAVMTPLVLEDFIDEIFSNILEVRECHRRLLEVMYVRQREQAPVIQSVGDIFLDAATEFRSVYPNYVGRWPMAEKRLKEEMEENPDFRLFLEKCSRNLPTQSEPGQLTSNLRLDLKHYLSRPIEHLQKYPLLLEAIYRETETSNPDGDYLAHAIAAIQNLQEVARLRTFQSAMGKGLTGKWEWHDLVSPEQRMTISQEECKRQSIIFELIKGEMAYVRDLENIETMYIRPLRNAEPPIIPSDRLDQFLTDVFHNYIELHAHHRRLVDTLHEIQREEHPRIRSITAAVYDAVLNFRESYMEYIPNYPIAEYRIDEEIAQNGAFKGFVESAVRHPDAHRLDLKNFINRPIPRLLRYELLLKQILAETPVHHDDRLAIPPVIELIKSLGKDTEPGLASSKQKVELWRFNEGLVFKSGEFVDMDLLNEQRSLIHTGRLIRPDNGNVWMELFVMLFDNYLMITRPREKDGVTKYHVYRRPIPLDLLAVVNFSEPAIQRSNSLFRSLRNSDQGISTSPLRTLRNGDTNTISPLRTLRGSPSTTTLPSRQQAGDVTAASSVSNGSSNADYRNVFPCSIYHNGRLGGSYTLYAESAAIRSEWKKKLEEAIGLRKAVQDSNKVFVIESLSVDTFLIPSVNTGPNSTVWHDGTVFTGRVTCSVPFKTPDGRGLVAIGCAEGIWIGYRYDSGSLRRVLHLKMVTQCAVLEDFCLFIVLADKVLYAYHLEALVPTMPGSVHVPHTPQRIHPKDVQFFSVGVLHGRTMIIYMKKRGNSDSVFHAVEPVLDKINERPRTSTVPVLGLKRKSEWFRHYKEFTFSDAHDLVFLKARIAVLCAKGFMIMDLVDYRSVTIPQRDHPNYPKRCDSCRPLGMFRPTEDEFLLCYDEFGLFVDRQGNPSRSTGTIEWEGTAERVAMHAPYVLLFDSRFIEVRHVETGRLVQVVPGNDIRCVWDGRALDGGAAAVPPEGNEDKMIQEPRVHAVMNLPEPPAQPGTRPVRGTMQHVFELFPTVPLYLPGSLSSPSTVPYFPVSFSPPRSPPLRSNHM